MSKYDHQLVFYNTITPLHVGCGQEVRLVDNPIIREKTTGFPFIPGSGIRGVLRDQYEGKSELETLFGHEPDASVDPGEDYAGCISIHDAKILFFPVRTSVNLFHWITCPYVIERFNRDTLHFNLVGRFFNKLEILSNNLSGPNECFSTFENGNISIFLEEFPFDVFNIIEEIESEDDQPGKLLEKWIVSNKFGINPDRTLVVTNHVFSYFAQHATIIQQHNRLTSAKTVADGALFSVESVPPETLFYGIIGGIGDRKTESDTFENGEKAIHHLLDNISDSDSSTVITLGGDESTGLGVTRMFWQKNWNGKKQQEGTDGKS